MFDLRLLRNDSGQVVHTCVNNCRLCEQLCQRVVQFGAGLKAGFLAPRPVYRRLSTRSDVNQDNVCKTKTLRTRTVQ